MKKVILGLAGLVMLVSGVAMVSAYEAHIINVTAHVEKALNVDPSSVNFGTVFPEEWFTRNVFVGLSTSFCADTQTRAKRVYFKVYAAWKPDGAGGYYPWLGDALYLGFFADQVPPANLLADNLTNVGPAPAGPPGFKPVLGGTQFVVNKFPLPPDVSYLVIGLDVPVFETYWNEDTDVATKPSGLSGPSYVIPKKLPDGSDNPAWAPSGVDLGVDIIIQVTNIEE